METKLCFERTEKGQQELFGGKRTLRPRERQVLFVIGDISCTAEVKSKICACGDFDEILRRLLEQGFIRPVFADKLPARCQDMTPDIRASLPPARVDEARQYVLQTIGALVGQRSPIYQRIQNGQGIDALLDDLGAAKKVISAVASSRQATELEEKTIALLCQGCESSRMLAEQERSARLPDLEGARQLVLETLLSLVGDRSPIYSRAQQVRSVDDLMALLPSCKKVIAAVASPAQALSLETGALAKLNGG
ncbi:MAG: hypothetical protein MUC79_06080 [Thiobacillaceae bacterium]|nr:hypothetical protein [Thiobacillaceae bacterium]